ncbi:MAG: J domain-containing protein [Pseudomonadota bacterium]
MFEEIRRLGGRYAVLSSNVALRQDGLPYASRRMPDDPGVAVYFQYGGTQMCFACDKWDRVGDNIWGIAKTIDAMRGIERWGTGEMMNRAFSAFEALPAPESSDWREILGLKGEVTSDQIKHRWRELSRRYHPDRGGSAEQMARINRARDQGMESIAAAP